MKIHKIMLLIIFSYLFASITACSKEYTLEVARNPNIDYRELNISYIKKQGTLTYDIDNDSFSELTFAIGYKNDAFNFYSGAVMARYKFLFHFAEVLYEPGQPAHYQYVQKKNLNDTVTKNISNWYSSINSGDPITIFERNNYKSLGTDKITGHYNEGEIYIPFRFFSATLYGQYGWYNAWMLIDCREDGMILKSIAFYKTIETPIKVGEK